MARKYNIDYLLKLDFYADFPLNYRFFLILYDIRYKRSFVYIYKFTYLYIYETSTCRILVFFMFDLFTFHNSLAYSIFIMNYLSIINFGNCLKTKVRFLRASHDASGNPSPNKVVRDTYDWHVKHPFVLSPFHNWCTSILQH